MKPGRFIPYGIVAGDAALIGCFVQHRAIIVGVAGYKDRQILELHSVGIVAGRTVLTQLDVEPGETEPIDVGAAPEARQYFVYQY